MGVPDSGRGSQTIRTIVEAKTLRISIQKAVAELGWRPTWHLQETVGRTVHWYRHYYQGGGASMQFRSIEDIDAYMAADNVVGNA